MPKEDKDSAAQPPISIRSEDYAGENVSFQDTKRTDETNLLIAEQERLKEEELKASIPTEKQKEKKSFFGGAIESVKKFAHSIKARWNKDPEQKAQEKIAKVIRGEQKETYEKAQKIATLYERNLGYKASYKDPIYGYIGEPGHEEFIKQAEGLGYQYEHPDKSREELHDIRGEHAEKIEKAQKKKWYNQFSAESKAKKAYHKALTSKIEKHLSSNPVVGPGLGALPRPSTPAKQQGPSAARRLEQRAPR